MLHLYASDGDKLAARAIQRVSIDGFESSWNETLDELFTQAARLMFSSDQLAITSIHSSKKKHEAFITDRKASVHWRYSKSDDEGGVSNGSNRCPRSGVGAVETG